MSDEQKKADPRLDVDRKRLAEFSCNRWFVCVEQGLSKEEILNPAFWTHHGHEFKQYDTVIVACDDGELYAELLVLSADRTWAKMHVLRWENLASKEVLEGSRPKSPADDFRIEHKGQHKQWCVIRKDGQIVREKEKAKADAQAWLDDYLRITRTGAQNQPEKAAA